jgi:cytochrome b6-f complex iron-sulfur subunit
MSCERCLNRREFFAKSAFAAAALVAAEACGDGQIGPTLPHVAPGGDPDAPTTTGVTIIISDFAALAAVGRLCDVQTERALVRTGPSTFQAYSKIGTHEQCITEIRNNRFECPCHGSIYAIDGSVIKGPDVQNSGITPLRALATAFDPAKGTVTIA